MQTPYRTLAVALLAGGFLTAHSAISAPAGKSALIKCWTNSEGVRECGNAVPPEYSQQETRTLNREGITVSTQGRAKTKAELAREAKDNDSEEARLAEKKRKEQERIKADNMLLAMFASERDITDARDRKVSVLQGNIDLSNGVIAKQQQKVESYRTRIAALERAGRPVPPSLKDDMALENTRLENRKAYVASQTAEIESIKTEYEGYLVRFRELMQER